VAGFKEDLTRIQVLLHTVDSREQLLFPSLFKEKYPEAFSFKEVLRMERSSSAPDRFSFLGTLVRTFRVIWTLLAEAASKPLFWRSRERFPQFQTDSFLPKGGWDGLNFIPKSWQNYP
jgi:hypothetical protein